MWVRINDHSAVVLSILYDYNQAIKFLLCILCTGNWFSYAPCTAANIMGVTLYHLDVMVLIVASA